MYYSRTLETFIRHAAGQFPVIMVTGARQVGKTTILRHLSGAERAYVTLDDPLILNLAKNDPGLFMQRFPPPVLIDEIQYAPELLPYIKMEADRIQEPNLFWLTGSQQFHLMDNVSESLAGRVGVISLSGISRMELAGRSLEDIPFVPRPDILRARGKSPAGISLKDLYRIIWRGSFPAIALREDMDRDLFYGSYVQTYLQRDVRSLSRVGDELSFLRFLRAAAARTGRLLNLVELARDADVAPNTAKSWMSILQASGIIYLLEPYHSSITKRLVKRPKQYMLDTGLCAYLTEWSSPEALEAGAMSGQILETWVISELLKSWWHNGRRAPFYYYRDKDQKEIDLIIEQDGILHPLEIKKTASPRVEDVRQFTFLNKITGNVGDGGIVCFARDFFPLSAHVAAIPVSLI